MSSLFGLGISALNASYSKGEQNMWYLRAVVVFLSLGVLCIFGLRSVYWYECGQSWDALLGTPPVIDCGPHPFEFSGDYRRSRLLNEGLIPVEELRPGELLQ